LRQLKNEPRQPDMDQQRTPDRYLRGKFSKLNQSFRLRFRTPELREMITAIHVTVYHRVHENRRSPASTKVKRRAPRVISSTTTARFQQIAESSNELKQQARIDGFVNIAQNVKWSTETEKRLTDTQHGGPHKPLLFDGIPQRSDTQQYAYNCRLTASDTGDGDGHQTHYTPVIKHTNEYGELFDGNSSLIKDQVASGDHHQTKAPPIRRCRIIKR